MIKSKQVKLLRKQGYSPVFTLTDDAAQFPLQGGPIGSPNVPQITRKASMRLQWVINGFLLLNNILLIA